MLGNKIVLPRTSSSSSRQHNFITEHFLGMEFNLCVTGNILGNKLLIAEKVLGNTILLPSIF